VTYAFDAELAAVIPMLPGMDDGDPDPVKGRELVAEMFAQIPRPDLTGVVVEDREIPGAKGDPDVRVRICRPEQQSDWAAIFNVHGGGFYLGDLDVDHARNVELARQLGVIVVSVDYRLAPETPFPGPLEDVYAGLLWLSENADELGVDSRRIGLHGESAGAGLCAGAALLARDRGGPHVAFQFLNSPEIDDRLGTASMKEFIDTPLWTRRRAAASWDYYLGPGRAGGNDVSIYAAPARAADLKGLPPAYIAVMQFDPLRDEGIAYAQALLAAGVNVELHLFPGTFHGSSIVDFAAISRRQLDEQIVVLRSALAT
jgi:acetyl esterase/lipase